ncbi:MAG: hypothetical protein HGA45_02925 [Chloroflexales bacterium]|nr:hypothetical protein [Chloroflexales bacterium]
MAALPYWLLFLAAQGWGLRQRNTSPLGATMLVSGLGVIGSLTIALIGARALMAVPGFDVLQNAQHAGSLVVTCLALFGVGILLVEWHLLRTTTADPGTWALASGGSGLLAWIAVLLLSRNLIWPHWFLPLVALGGLGALMGRLSAFAIQRLDRAGQSPVRGSSKPGRALVILMGGASVLAVLAWMVTGRAAGSPQELTLAQAREQALFPVLEPQFLPSGYSFESAAITVNADGTSLVALFYTGPRGRLAINEWSQATPLPPIDDRVEARTIRAQVARLADNGDGTYTLFWNDRGRSVVIYTLRNEPATPSDLTEEALLAVAESMR